MTPPDISVVIPVFNGERFLAQAIESVLAQEHLALEVVVIDDGSTDTSAAIAAAFGGSVRCVSQPNRGPGAARNAGVTLTEGRRLAFLDADDLWLPNKLRLQASRLDADPALECVFGLVDHFHEPGESVSLDVRVPPATAGLVPGAMLINREAFSQVGPFSADLAVGEFIEWFGRARSCGLRYEVLQQVVLRRRIHSDNLSRRQQASRTDYLQALRANLNRARRQGAP